MSDEWDASRLDMVDFLRRILLTAEEARKEDFDLLLSGMPRASYLVRERVVTIVQESDGSYVLEVRDARRSSKNAPIVYRYCEEGKFLGCEKSGTVESPKPNEVEADDWILTTRQEGITLDEE